MNIILGILAGFGAFVVAYIVLAIVCAIVSVVIGGSAKGRADAYDALSSLAVWVAIILAIGVGIHVAS